MAKTATNIESVTTINLAPLLFALDKLKREAGQSLSVNEELKGELGSKIDAIVKEREIKTVGEKVNDLAETVAKSPEIGNGSEIGIMAKKIELAVEEIERQYPKELEALKKDEFKKTFEKEAKKINPGLDENQLKTVKDYGDLVAENYFGDNTLEGQKNEALEANSRLFSPGRLESSWTDLKGVVNFLQKSPEKLKGIKEKYNSLKEGLRGVNLPNLKEGRSFEKIMAGFNDPNTDQLFARTKKYLGWADRVDKLTGGWLNKTVTKAGMKVVNKIGNQAVQEFTTNALGTIAKEGFQKGFSTVLKGIMSGGVKEVGKNVAGEAGKKIAVKLTAKIAAKLGIEAGVAATGVGAPVALAMVLYDVVKFIKNIGSKIAEKLGIGIKKGLEENFGKVGGAILGGITSLVALPAILIGSVSAVAVGPIIIIVIVGLFGYQLMQGSLVSSLVPPKGAGSFNSEEIIDAPGKIDVSIDDLKCSVAEKVILTSQKDPIYSDLLMSNKCPGEYLADSGCGPTAASQILQGKNSLWTPRFLLTQEGPTHSPFFNKDSIYKCNEGSYPSQLVDTFKQYLGEKSINKGFGGCTTHDIERMICENRWAVIIDIFWSGGGHYMTAVGVNKNGEIIVKDPNGGNVIIFYPDHYLTHQLTSYSCLGVNIN